MNDEKKKIIVLGALFALILAVGAFQMVGGPKGGATTPVADKKKVETKGTEKPPLKNPEVGFELAARDPFQAPDSETPMLAPNKTVAPPVTPQPERRVHQLPRATETMPYHPLGGQLSMDGHPGGLPAPTQPKAVEPSFGYSLAGVIVGARPAAVF